MQTLPLSRWFLLIQVQIAAIFQFLLFHSAKYFVLLCHSEVVIDFTARRSYTNIHFKCNICQDSFFIINVT